MINTLQYIQISWLSDNLNDEISELDYFDGLVQDCSNSIGNALELLQSCTKPSIWWNGFILQNHSRKNAFFWSDYELTLTFWIE